MPCQPKSYVSGGNNSRGFALSGNGCATAVISLPTRYIHSPSCVASEKDFIGMLPLTRKIKDAVCSGEVL